MADCIHGRVSWPDRSESGGWTCADCAEETIKALRVVVEAARTAIGDMWPSSHLPGFVVRPENIARIQRALLALQAGGGKL